MRQPLPIVTRGGPTVPLSFWVLVFLGVFAVSVVYLNKGDFPFSPLSQEANVVRGFRVASVKLEQGVTALSNTAWSISGTLINETKSFQSAPDLDISLSLVETGQQVAHTKLSLGKKPLPQGAGIRFSATLRGPAGQDVDVAIKPVAPRSSSLMNMPDFSSQETP